MASNAKSKATPTPPADASLGLFTRQKHQLISWANGTETPPDDAAVHKLILKFQESVAQTRELQQRAQAAQAEVQKHQAEILRLDGKIEQLAEWLAEHQKEGASAAA